MDSLALRHLEPQDHHLRRGVRQGRRPDLLRRRSSSSAPPSTRREDADITLQLHQAMWPHVAASDGLTLHLPEHRTADRGGAAEDRAQRRADRRRAARQRSRTSWAGACWSSSSRRMSWPGGRSTSDSPKQIGEIFFDKLKLPVVKKTPSGAPSTDEEVLQKLAEDYPLPKILLEYRGLSKLKSTYTDKLPKMVNAAHRPRAHQLRAGGRGDRPPGVERAQPAEHPDPHRRGPAHPRSLHRAARQRDRVGRLFADRAAHHGAHLGRRRACCARSPTARTSTAPPPPKSSASRRPRSAASSGATPRSSTSA